MRCGPASTATTRPAGTTCDIAADTNPRHAPTSSTTASAAKMRCATDTTGSKLSGAASCDCRYMSAGSATMSTSIPDTAFVTLRNGDVAGSDIEVTLTALVM